MKLREKTTAILLIAILMMSMIAVSAIAKKDYAKIQDGTITYGRVNDPSTEIIPIGYDQWGYNYQAHLFNGWYHNNLRPDPPYTKDTIDQAPSKTWLIMKWSDTWLSNMDRDGDGKLDRGYPYPTGTSDPPIYTSSAAPGAWVTNHQFGEYEKDGKIYKWNYFVKIVYPSSDWTKSGTIWIDGDNVEMGTIIWGSYAITLQIYNDQGEGVHGVEYNPESPTGLGCYK